MWYVASVNENNDAIVFSNNSSIFSKYSSIAIVVETLPEGTGQLKCDGAKIWYEPIPVTPTPDPVPYVPTNEELAKENAELKAKVTASIQSNSNLEECLVEMAGIVYA